VVHTDRRPRRSVLMERNPGDNFGPYEVVSPIGKGGMGEVWKATDTRLHRDVAIKFCGKQFSARFLREARAIASLNHPNICTLYDVGPDYLVMEYLEGRTLSGPLPPDEALRLATQVASALEAAHAKGILHRDLKPANIMITAAGAKLLDFGLARMATVSDADALTTLAGTLAGTPAYMSPEQAQGQTLDERSDIFSFGTVLYELLSGRCAFAGDSMLDVLNAVVRDEPPPLQSPAADVVKRCMAKQPSQRFQTMTDVRAALSTIGTKAAASQPSIAVLPFANMSADKDQEYFSDGLAEEIINALAQIPDLKVTARTSAFAFRGKEQDITKIAEALKVATILEGSVRRSGNRIRVTAQLINAADGYHLWSQRYDRELEDVFAVQDDIAAAITLALRLQLSGKPEAARQYRPNLPAYEACLKGRHFLMKNTPEALMRGKAYLEQAIALDPGYAEPHAELGVMYLVQSAWGLLPASEMLLVARNAAQHAMDLSPEEPRAHIVLGAVAAFYDWDWEKSADHFRIAMANHPVPADVHARYGIFHLIPLGRWQEALEEMRKALEPDPLNVLWRSMLAWILVSIGKCEEGIAEGHKALEINKRAWLAMQAIGNGYLYMGMLAEARASAENAMTLAPWNGWVPGTLAGISAISGHKERVDDLLTVSNPLGLASYHLICSQVDAAIDWYRKALEQHDVYAAMTLASPSEFMRPLWESPRWAELRGMMNLPETCWPRSFTR
jgi:serine/threonine protein kinase